MIALATGTAEATMIDDAISRLELLKSQYGQQTKVMMSLVVHPAGPKHKTPAKRTPSLLREARG